MTGRVTRPRFRAALVSGALLVAAVPAVALATAPHLSCAPKPVGRWEAIKVAPFAPVSGLNGSDHDVVETYTVNEQKPQNVATTNGYAIQVSKSHGCAWSRVFELSPTVTGSQPFLGTGAQIVSVALLGGRALAAVQEGSGAASRPHVLVSADGGAAGSWATSDNGLPTQGAPRLLRAASDGRTAYLTISPTATGGSDNGGGTTGLPGGLTGGVPGTGGTPTGFLYRTTDGGGSWTLQTGAGDLPGGGTGFSQLDIDPSNSNTLYGIVGGRLLTSRDGGATFTAVGGSSYTAVTAGSGGQVFAFGPNGGVQSFDGGRQFTGFRAPAGVTSAASRLGSSRLVVEVSGNLLELEPGTGQGVSIPAGLRPRPGTLLGDRGDQSSAHAIAGHSLLRYVDPTPPGQVFTPLPVGDLSVAPPLPGVVTPRARNVSLPVGQSSIEDFTLDLPKNPTPLDLFFLNDVSASMSDYLIDLQKNIRSITRSLVQQRVDLNVGIGTIGTGPGKGQAAFPPEYVDPLNPTRRYVKPTIYKRLRAIGPPNAQFDEAVQLLAVETPPPVATDNLEGQLIALKNLANGAGTRTEEEQSLKDRQLPSTITGVAPNQGANWRGSPDVRRIVILATNEYMQAPFGGQPDTGDNGPGSNRNDPQLEFGPTLKLLQDNRIKVIGLTAGEIVAAPDLKRVAQGTGMLAPPGGVRCDEEQIIPAGQPIVCNNGDEFSAVISRLLASLSDRQDVVAVPHNRTPVLGTLDAGALKGLDVKKPSSGAFRVRVSCVDVKPGSYVQDVDLVLRNTIVGRARVNVTCLKEQAIVKPRPVAAVPDPPAPPAQPAPNPPPPPPAPAPPAAQPQAQPQPQVQTQVQLQPLTAGAIQEQQELQLALAMAGTLKDDDPAFNAGQQMAMVDRRQREQVQALGLLAFAITASAGLGLARLRARPEVRARRAD